MWKALAMGENLNEKHMDLCTIGEASSVIDHPLGTVIGTTPAIAHMIMAPKSTGTDYPTASPGYIVNLTPKKDPQLSHLQRDLNSPSAALRMRAMRALKSPTKAYNNFDVPHAEISIITAEERTPCPPPLLYDILKDVIVYVEVRTGSDNRSEGVKTIIAKLGAQVNDRLLRNTTHVVFKDGLLSTYKRAQTWNIPIVSILWIEACKVQRRLCEPQQFPISNIHMYEYPELYGKMSRVRCMQPDSELNKRPRKRQGTPTGTKDKDKSTITTTPQNSIARFFMPLSQTKQLAEGENPTDSPATKLLNRITNGCFTPVNARSQPKLDNPQAAKANDADPNGEADVAVNKQAIHTSMSYSQGAPLCKPRSSSLTVEPATVFTPLRASQRRSSMFESPCVGLAADKVQSEPRLTRRRSLLNMSQKTSTKENTSEMAVQSEQRMTRRRSSLIGATPLVEETPDTPTQQEFQINRRRSFTFVSTIEPSTPTLVQKPSFSAIAEEPLVEPSTSSGDDFVQETLDMSCTPAAPSKTQLHQKTNYVQESMEISVSRALIISKATGRRTLYTTGRMDISEPNDENRNPYLEKSLYSNVTTQTSLHSLDEHSLLPVFSSTRLPGSNSSSHPRRSLFNVDMELINERINNINNTSQRRSLALANEAELGESRALTPLQAVATNVTTDMKQISTEPKKRRLFTPNDEVVLSSASSSCSNKSYKAHSGTPSSTGTVKRRRTLATLKPTAEVGPTLQNKSDTGGESDPGKERFVTPFDSDATNDSTSESHGDGVRQETKRRIIHTLVHTNMHKDQVQVIHKAIRKLRGMRLDPTVTKRTTHLISLEPRRTLNLLRGLMRGVWIVSYKWVLDSVRAGKWVNEEKYELTSFSRSVEICRTERQAFGISYRCELFRYMETFYVSSLCRPITFNNIKELLLLGGAKLTENRYKAKFIVGDKRRAEDDRIYLSPLWVLDSITAMQIQKFAKYLMKCAIVTPYGIRYEDPCQEREKPRRHLKVCYKDPALVINK